MRVWLVLHVLTWEWVGLKILLQPTTRRSQRHFHFNFTLLQASSYIYAVIANELLSLCSPSSIYQIQRVFHLIKPIIMTITDKLHESTIWVTKKSAPSSLFISYCVLFLRQLVVHSHLDPKRSKIHLKTFVKDTV